ncbi:MOSC N-terminal beta barrel domain-containing protein [Klenkia sp. LSe6-5]|uniref:MOSC N-terminal beta barrel domain-containing protein n=1 Tax=Klenkia sesuvii TaxID=3103137 RepID=A0ABU8DS52_9ACTN
MQVLELWRYPVKSLQGERCAEVEVGPEGFVGDRAWALFDTSTGFGLTARRVPELLFAAARTTGGRPDVVLPDGTVTSDDAVLSAWVGRPVELRPASYTGPRTYENPDDVDTESRWNPFSGADGAFHDNAGSRITLLSTGSTGTWAPRRFRANVLLDGDGEDALVGQRVRLGTAELDVVAPVPRCVMTTRPQPGGVGRDTGVLKTIHRTHDGTLSVGAMPVGGGRIAVGDELQAW